MDGVQLQSNYKAREPLCWDSLRDSLIPQYVVLISSTAEGWKAELTLEPFCGFEPKTLGLGIQCLNHYAITSALDPKVCRFKP